MPLACERLLTQSGLLVRAVIRRTLQVASLVLEALLDELARLRALSDPPTDATKAPVLPETQPQVGGGSLSDHAAIGWVLDKAHERRINVDERNLARREVAALRAERDAAIKERDEALGIREGLISPVQKVLQERARADAAETRALTPFDGSGIAWHEGLPSPYTYQASDFSKLVAAVHEYASSSGPRRESNNSPKRCEAGVRSIHTGGTERERHALDRRASFRR